MYTSTQIEDAILHTFSQDRPMASYVKLFTPLISIDYDDWKDTIHKYPAVGVTSPIGKYRYQMSNIQEEIGTFLIYCINRNLRSATAPLHGSDNEKGVWDMIDDCRRVLSTGDIGLEDVIDCIPIQRMLIGAIDDQSAKKLRLAVAALQIEVKWRNG